MPNCYTCHEDIVFDKSILSKTGKQIPLWPDKLNTHTHDEDGKPIRGELPKDKLPVRNDWNTISTQRTKTSTESPETQSTSGGSYMDTKRLRVMVEDLNKKVNENTEVLQSCYELCKNNNNMLGEIMRSYGLTQPTTAADLYKKQQQGQVGESKKPAVDPTSVNHGRIADENELREKEYPELDKLRDDIDLEGVDTQD